MKTLVLDRSAVVGAPPGFLQSLRGSFDFLLTDTLLHDICTEQLDHSDSLSTDERAVIRRRRDAAFRKIQKETGNLWMDNETALQWEIMEGCSARHAPHERLPFTPSIDMFSQEWTQFCREYQANRARLMSMVRAPDDQEGFEWVCRLEETELFHELRERYSSARGRRSCALEAKSNFSDLGAKRGLRVAASFAPEPDWFSFGIILAGRVYRSWNFWRYSGNPPGLKKPANPFFDTVYVSHIAIADGVLSCDKDLLRMAWACYPEKEGDLYELDAQTRSIATFKPPVCDDVQLRSR